jgi:hypothetical protein
MSDPVKFEGKIVRIERDGFGIVEFSPSIGANTHGIFSLTTSESLPPIKELKLGLSVTGMAEPVDTDLAAVKTLDLAQH